MTGKRMSEEMPRADFIGGFPFADPNCKGCNKPLTLENAWSTDGCPCNSPLGVNNMNETRWRLLMQLQQKQSFQLATARKMAAALQGIVSAHEAEGHIRNSAAAEAAEALAEWQKEQP